MAGMAGIVVATGGIGSVGIGSIGRAPTGQIGAPSIGIGIGTATPQQPAQSPNAGVSTGFDATPAPTGPPVFRPTYAGADERPTFVPEPPAPAQQGPSSDMIEQVASAYAANRIGT